MECTESFIVSLHCKSSLSFAMKRIAIDVQTRMPKMIDQIFSMNYLVVYDLFREYRQAVVY